MSLVKHSTQSNNSTSSASRSLTTQQLQILTTLYKFRYVTAELITQNLRANHKRVILARLKILEDQAYIAKNYDKSYKLKGRPASYYLLPKGIQVLRKQSFSDTNALKRIYYDKNQNDVHITHRLNVFKTFIYIKWHYPKQFQFYSKTELASWKHIPKDLTDAYLKGNALTSTEANQELDTSLDYFMSYIEPSAKSWRLRNAISRYMAYAESRQWQEHTGKDFPVVLLVCEDRKQQRRLQSVADNLRQESYANISFKTLALGKVSPN